MRSCARFSVRLFWCRVHGWDSLLDSLIAHGCGCRCNRHGAFNGCVHYLAALHLVRHQSTSLVVRCGRLSLFGSSTQPSFSSLASSFLQSASSISTGKFWFQPSGTKQVTYG